MKHVEILTFCDACWADGEVRTPGTESFTVGIMRGEALFRPRLRVLIMCDAHAKSVVDIAELAEAHGEDVKMPETNGKPHKHAKHSVLDPGRCPFCHTDFRYIGIHLNTVHKFTIDDQCPRTSDGNYECPTCGHAERSKHGISTHHMAAHGQRITLTLAELATGAKPKPVKKVAAARKPPAKKAVAKKVAAKKVARKVAAK